MLNINDISAAYGSVEVLWDINIEVNQGEIVTLIGANGAGKSTILKLISGIIKPKKGTVSFRNEKITGKTPEIIVKMGLIQIPEGRQIFTSLTVMQNLYLGAYANKIKKDDLNTQLHYVYDLFPILEKRKNYKAGTLSGGEQQMLAFGRALMAQPKMLLLDEPSLGLAPIIVNQIFEIIEHLRKDGIPILLVEQNAVMAINVADRAYIIENGKIVKHMEAGAMLEDNEIRRNYLGK